MKGLISLLSSSLVVLTAAQENGASQTTIAMTITADASLTSLVGILSASGLLDALDESGSFTLFAPIDESFVVFPPSFLECFVGQTQVLSDFLLYHVVDSAISTADLSNGQMVPTLGGPSLSIDTTAGIVIDQRASILRADIPATNGVIHIIDECTYYYKCPFVVVSGTIILCTVSLILWRNTFLYPQF